jgi:hypothetical protein
MKYIFSHISYLPATCFGAYNWSHLQAELLSVICTIGMLVSYEIVWEVAVHLQKLLEVMSTSVYTGLNPN